MSLFVPKFCKAIYETLKKEYLKVLMPEGAYEKWQFPNAYVAIDGKQVSLFHPHSGASEYYKGFYSLLFMAIVAYDYLL